ncbi:MAG TPA: hypothetical protein VGO56_09650 [Pyrinomonadaceae bacterium]|jgi:hypothetical protein|nr:hypothetical protein [Pyrinomonadaceae bacterium]
MSAALGTVEQYSQGERKTLESVTLALARWTGELFGCKHREMSRPFSRHGETYRVCNSCGARRRFDAETWNSSGAYYFKPARTSDLQDVDMSALRCI